MASAAADTDSTPAVLGRRTEELEANPSVNSLHLPSNCNWALVSTTSLSITMITVQVAVYSIAYDHHYPGTYCREGYTRFERWAWLSPLYCFGPWSAVALIATFVHRTDRFNPKMFLHRWTWRLALCNLVAATFCALSAMLRECNWRSSTWKIGEAICNLFYFVSESILLGLVHSKVQALQQVCAARWLLSLFIFMLTMLVLAFVPCMFWESYVTSSYRISVICCYLSAFMASLVIATRAMLNAADLADLAIDKFPAPKRTQLYMLTNWTRWTGRATLGSMVSSILMQGTYCVWLYYGCPTSLIRFTLDWFLALDFVMNVWCAANLAGMIGPRANLDHADTAFQEVGYALIGAIPQDIPKDADQTNPTGT